MSTRPVVLYNPLTAPLARPNVPLSLLALARMLPRDKYRPVLVNAAAERRAHERVLEALADNAVLFGISAMTGYQIRDGLRLARKVRKRYPRLPIVWGGYHPSLLPRETLADPCVDCVVIGQGERLFAEMVDRLAEGEPAAGLAISGADDAATEASSSRRTPRRPLEPLDSFPHLPWDLIDLTALRPIPGYGPAADFYTSQGCPYACGFCAEESVHGRHRRSLSPGRAVEEIAHLATLGIRAVQMRDMLFFADPRWIEEFCHEIARRKVPVTFHGANGRIDGLLAFSPAQWELIDTAGVREIFVGVESGHAPALARIDKRIRPEETLSLVERVRGSRIRLSLSVMLGVPGVDPEAELHDTLALLREAVRIEPGRISSIYVFLYAPYPGSRLYAEAVELGFRPPNTLDGWGRLDLHGTEYPWGSRAARRTAYLLHHYVLPRVLHTEPSRLRAVEAICRALDPGLRRRWEEGRFDRFWERGVYDGLNGLRGIWRRTH
jgi:radical SAM superfamily enzyme YgiQ (UPF0313 family)